MLLSRQPRTKDKYHQYLSSSNLILKKQVQIRVGREELDLDKFLNLKAQLQGWGDSSEG